jgi:hypothetical protein
MLLRKAACSGVVWITNDCGGNATKAEASKVESPKVALGAPIDENPVSCLHVPSHEKK